MKSSTLKKESFDVHNLPEIKLLSRAGKETDAENDELDIKAVISESLYSDEFSDEDFPNLDDSMGLTTIPEFSVYSFTFLYRKFLYLKHSVAPVNKADTSMLILELLSLARFSGLINYPSFYDENVKLTKAAGSINDLFFELEINDSCLEIIRFKAERKGVKIINWSESFPVVKGKYINRFGFVKELSQSFLLKSIG